MGVQTASEQETFIVRVDKRYTAQDFEKMPEGPPYFELINNRLVMEASPELPHQRSSLSIAKKLDDFVEQHSRGIVLEAPMDVELDADNVFQPDILYISKERFDIIKEGRKIKGAPDLVIEILSSNKKYDQEEKKYVYELHDVLEFWLVDVKKKQVEVYENVRKEFVLRQKAYPGDTIYSKILKGFELPADYVFREIPTPKK